MQTWEACVHSMGLPEEDMAKLKESILWPEGIALRGPTQHVAKLGNLPVWESAVDWCKFNLTTVTPVTGTDRPALSAIKKPINPQKQEANALAYGNTAANRTVKFMHKILLTD